MGSRIGKALGATVAGVAAVGLLSEPAHAASRTRTDRFTYSTDWGESRTCTVHSFHDFPIEGSQEGFAQTFVDPGCEHNVVLVRATYYTPSGQFVSTSKS